MSSLTRREARRNWSRPITAGVVAFAFTVMGTNVAHATPETLSEKEFDAFVAEISALAAELEPAAPTTEGEDAVADALEGTAFEPELLDGLIDETVALPDGVSLADGSVAMVSDEGDAASVTSGDLDSGLSVTFEVSETTTVEAADGVVVAEGEASETFVGQTTEAGGQLIYVMEDATADPTVTINTEVPAGYSWLPSEDGGVALQSADSETPLVVVSAPWAVDAAGTPLNTSFSVTEAGLVQTIDTTGAVFPVVADPDWWWWTKNIAGCVAEVALLAAGGAKVLAAFAKADKIIKASKTMVNAFKALGSKWDDILKSIRKYVQDKSKLTSKQVKSLETFLGAVGTTVMGVLGIGTCYDVYKELK